MEKEKVDEYKEAKNFPALLLAEDDISARQRLSMALGKEGWQVFEAGDGDQVLKIFQERKVDIALLDPDSGLRRHRNGQAHRRGS